MDDSTVVTFFYGSYMNPAVLREVDIVPDRIEAAMLPGFDIEIRPLANLLRAEQNAVYGANATATHAKLKRLYAHAEEVLGGLYLPHPVLTQTASGQWEPALTYIAPDLKAGQATADYVDRIVQPGRQYGFPDWYISKLESFLP